MELKITIPTELKEIKLNQYQQFLNIAKGKEDSEFLRQKMIQIFCGIDLKDVAEIKYKDVEDITAKINQTFDVKNYKFINRFKMGGVEFGFIPNLEDISFGEYTDLDTYICDWDLMHKAMAVMYRPITQKGLSNTYEIEKYKGSNTYSDVMKHAPLDVVLGANVFFYTLGNDLLASTMSYLENSQAMATIQQSANLGNGGDGITQSMLLLKEMLQDLTQSQSYHLRNV